MENSIGKSLRNIGSFTIFIGIIIGFFKGFDNSDLYETTMHWSIVFLWSAIGFVSGMLFIGFSEVLYLLQGIYINLEKKEIESKLDVPLNEINEDCEDNEKPRADVYNSIMENKNEDD
ncbi:hypothetical protein [Neobacillus sp. PS3-40]|uniref:hypothetical protein n=1 Tax=Neobacillus sp. PS3-40 TaxID=3070679 RepID=UPI0027E0B854|nr:hypothetical protein [Neobacillus sp. PS3-40]WML44101.1 hypothetical protein RCG20_20345 [Neobacillus sp. PS3-40]